MTAPRIPDDVRLDLQAMGLTIWTMHHPIHFDYDWNGNGPKRGRENKAIVHLTLIGPGLDGAQGTGATVREAVAAAMRHPALLKRQGGLTGAMAGLEEELRLLRDTILLERYREPGQELADVVPF